MNDPNDKTAPAILKMREAIVRKGMRLQIATELYAAWLASDRGTATEEFCKKARGAALQDADALITDNEAMP